MTRQTPRLLALLVVLALASGSCRARPESLPAAPLTPAPAPAPPPPLEWALAIHGGAGVIAEQDSRAEGYFRALAEALALGADLLRNGNSAIEVVEAVVMHLENDPKFNAGKGAVFTDRGTHELDAAIMDGRTLACGAVAGVRNVRNPIQLARQVMERSPHVLLAGPGADAYGQELGVSRAPQDYFTTAERYEEWQRARREQRQIRTSPAQPPASTGADRPDLGTVGAVALDRYHNLAAATSTGGLTNKRYGRVGDVPIVGAGTYAKNTTAALSGTGRGEEFIRHTVTHDISARMEYQGLTLAEAVRTLIHGTLAEGDGGVIGVDRRGNIVLDFNTPGMFRGAADAGGRFEVGIWKTMRSQQASPSAAPTPP